MPNFINYASSEEEANDAAKSQIEELIKKTNEIKAKKRSEFIKPEKESINGDSNLFLLLFVFNDEDETTAWEIADNRQEAYDIIKNNIEDLNLVESKIVSETVSFAEAFSFAAFMTHVLDSGKIEDPGFDPRDYIPDDWDIDDEEFIYEKED